MENVRNAETLKCLQDFLTLLQGKRKKDSSELYKLDKHIAAVTAQIKNLSSPEIMLELQEIKRVEDEWSVKDLQEIK